MENKKRIMIIDDEQDLVEMMKYQFVAGGFDVTTAADGIQGLEAVHTYKPDLIILDMNMPRMGGIEFFSKICDSKGRPLYPVLVLTARANVGQLFKEFAIDGFLIKPFDIEQLVVEADMIIKRKLRVKKNKDGLTQGTRKICIAQRQPGILKEIAGEFLAAGYTVIPGRNGSETLEHLVQEVPDVALIELGLEDLSGDLIILRLSQMCQSMDIRCVLYTLRNDQHDSKIMEKIEQKTGVLELIEYEQPQDLLQVVDNLLIH